jgi:hypothetical protein
VYRVECLAKGTNVVICWDTAKTLARAKELAKIYSTGEQKYTYTRIEKVL